MEERSYRAVEFAAKPPKFWSSDKKRNMRLFFESIAKKSQFDPLVAKNWYGVERETVLQAKVLFPLFIEIFITFFHRVAGIF